MAATAVCGPLPLGPLRGFYLEGVGLQVCHPDLPCFRTCNECGKHAVEGRQGEDTFGAEWFCSACWHVWESVPPAEKVSSHSLPRPSVVERLMGCEALSFFRNLFGGSWVINRCGSSPVDFSVEECLSMLTKFQPERSLAMRMDRTRFTASLMRIGKTRVVDNASSDAIESPCLQRFGNFWNCTMCRHDIQNDFFETVEEEAQVLAFLREKELRTCSDLKERGDGWTFILNQVQNVNGSLQRFHRALFAEFGLTGGFNAYLTPGHAMGKAPHSDDHDVFIVQQAGSKVWTLLYLDNQTVLTEIVLNVGDVLYIPQGIPHYAVSVADEPSLHLAMSVRRTAWTCAGILAAVLELSSNLFQPLEVCRESIEWRRGLLSESAAPMHPLNQLLPYPLGAQFLFAFSENDLPQNSIDEAASLLLSLARQLLDTTSSNSQEVNQSCPRGLDEKESVIENAQPDRCQSTAALDVWRRTTTRVRRAFDILKHNKNCAKRGDWAAGNFQMLKEVICYPSGQFLDVLATTIAMLREFHFDDHFLSHGMCLTHEPLASTRIDSLLSSKSARFQRADDCAALLRRDGVLVLNGQRIVDIQDDEVPALIFFLGVYSGSMRRPFALAEAPGSATSRNNIAAMLLQMGGLQVVRE